MEPGEARGRRLARWVPLLRRGHHSLQLLKRPNHSGPDDVTQSGAAILDTHPSAQYGAGHVRGSWNIGLSGQFASWAGTLLKPETPIVLVAEDGQRVREARMRLARVGLENVAGYLEGGVLSWDAAELALATTEQITVDELAARIREKADLQVLDVRRPGEWQAGHIARALHVPLNTLPGRIAEVRAGKSVAAICAGGYRSSIATSILERRGFHRITNVIGGMSAWRSAKLEVGAA